MWRRLPVEAVSGMLTWGSQGEYLSLCGAKWDIKAYFMEYWSCWCRPIGGRLIGLMIPRFFLVIGRENQLMNTQEHIVELLYLIRVDERMVNFGFLGRRSAYEWHVWLVPWSEPYLSVASYTDRLAESLRKFAAWILFEQNYFNLLVAGVHVLKRPGLNLKWLHRKKPALAEARLHSGGPA